MDALKNRTIVIANGLGRDSMAVLIGFKQRGIRPNAILFADVGSEKPGTYAYIPIVRDWLRKADFPDLTIVRYQPVRAPYTTIEGNMVMNATLPGATFGKGSCTLKFKVEPQNRHCRSHPDCLKAWTAGEKVMKIIGFEADEEYRQKRAADKAHAGKGSPDSKKYEWVYPLMEWGWNLKRCIEEIQNAGLPVPPKSACFCCPNQKPCEVDDLDEDQRARIIRIELRAEPYNKKVKGLWRKKSITQYILEKGLAFKPLPDLDKESPMPLNPNCGKYCNGCTFKPPHDEVGLADLLKQHGHRVGVDETAQHLDLVASL